MSKPALRPYTRYSHEAVQLLGALIRNARIEQRITVVDLATRAGVSRGLVQRAEAGEPSCAIGVVFELAALLGVRLFNADDKEVNGMLQTARDRMTLLPSKARALKPVVFDDF